MTKLRFSIAVLLAAFLLAGCGGSSSTAVDTPPPDADGDTVADADDAFPYDPMETKDSDGDGVGDNADAFPDDPMETTDTDGNGVGDNADPDIDGDGVANAADAFPEDSTEWADADMDGVGDNADADVDGDGVADADDPFPNDPTEWADADMDGVGNNADFAPNDPTVQVKPTHEDVTMMVALGSAEQRLLKASAELSEAGDSDTLEVPAGKTVRRAGVDFSCMSTEPCTITITNNLGTITASVSTRKLVGAEDPMVTAEDPTPKDTFALLTEAQPLAVRNLVTAQAGTTTPPTLTETELIGMGIGGPGVLDAGDAGLRSDFQANGADLTVDTSDSSGDRQTDSTVDASAPGLAPDLEDGTKITAAMMPDGDGITASDDMAAAPADWTMHTLFRDWGDTAGDGDGGFETGSIVVENLGDGTPHAFDRKLSGRYVNTAAQNMFALAIRANGANPGVTTLGTSVYIGADEFTPTGGQDALPAAASEQWANMVFDEGSLVPAQSQDLNVNAGETFRGSYFGAPGQFQCIGTAGTGQEATTCGLARNADGMIAVNDTNADPDETASGGRWSFTPDPDAMITVPDQDWMAYGAWLTTPDDQVGDHRLGVFFNGMDPWTTTANAIDATNAAGLRGKATYSGGATGVYVDGVESGLFTAEAMLTAVFDGDMDGVDDDGVDYRISGRIDNFRGTDGVALGADTGDMANPQGRGENDWVITLGPLDIVTTGIIAATATAGSADGVSWTGSWEGQMFGPSTDADGDALAPSGVAGRFWAETADVATPVQTDAMPATAVVGAFGAMKE